MGPTGETGPTGPTGAPSDVTGPAGLDANAFVISSGSPLINAGSMSTSITFYGATSDAVTSTKPNTFYLATAGVVFTFVAPAFSGGYGGMFVGFNNTYVVFDDTLAYPYIAGVAGTPVSYTQGYNAIRIVLRTDDTASIYQDGVSIMDASLLGTTSEQVYTYLLAASGVSCEVDSMTVNATGGSGATGPTGGIGPTGPSAGPTGPTGPAGSGVGFALYPVSTGYINYGGWGGDPCPLTYIAGGLSMTYTANGILAADTPGYYKFTMTLGGTFCDITDAGVYLDYYDDTSTYVNSSPCTQSTTCNGSSVVAVRDMPSGYTAHIMVRTGAGFNFTGWEARLQVLVERLG